MSAVLAYEVWPAGGPQSLAYFCGCMQVPTTGTIDPATMLALAATNAQNWLDANILNLWPNASPATVSTSNGVQVASYNKANFDISDLYVQTPFGSNVASRFNPGSSAGFANLYVIGDWTKTRFSGGCFESSYGIRDARRECDRGVPADRGDQDRLARQHVTGVLVQPDKVAPAPCSRAWRRGKSEIAAQ